MGIHRLLESFDGLTYGLTHFRDALGAKDEEQNYSDDEQFGYA